MRDDFSERLPSMGDGNIDVGVENLDQSSLFKF